MPNIPPAFRVLLVSEEPPTKKPVAPVFPKRSLKQKGGFLGSLLARLGVVDDTASRAEEAQQEARELGEHSEAMRAYEADLAKWQEERERRKIYNATVRQAELHWHAEKKNAHQLYLKREEWRVKAEEALAVFRHWRASFEAECVAAHGPRTSDEINRLCKEAFPHTAISVDARLGYLHHYASTMPEIAAIKGFLPREIARP